MARSPRPCFLALVGSILVSGGTSAPALATTPYSPVPIGAINLGPGLASPSEVFGKEYSHNMDYGIDPVGTFPSPEQVVAWDGSGGVDNGLNYFGTRPNFTRPSQVDALANRLDAMFAPLLVDQSHLIYSISTNATAYVPNPISGGGFHVAFNVPTAGLIPIPDAIKGGSNLIGGGRRDLV